MTRGRTTAQTSDAAVPQARVPLFAAHWKGYGQMTRKGKAQCKTKSTQHNNNNGQRIGRRPHQSETSARRHNDTTLKDTGVDARALELRKLSLGRGARVRLG